jgi:hypothetical protein
MTTLLYVTSVIAANLFAARFGPRASILSAFLLIGATMTLRDKLHEEWRGRHLVPKMGGAILLAGLLSALVSASAKRIAVASVVAFVMSELVDALIYHALGRRRWLERANGSNIPAALVDSILFPTLAFGGFLPVVILGQFVAKVFGGSLWAYVMQRFGFVSAACILAMVNVNVGSAQVISLNGAWIHNPYVSAPAGEVFVGAPPILNLRPYVIASWNSSESWSPTILARVGYLRPAGKFMLGAGAGIISLPNLRTPHPSVSAIAMGPDFNRFRPYVVAAYEKTPDWTWTTFMGLNYTVYFRK